MVLRPMNPLHPPPNLQDVWGHVVKLRPRLKNHIQLKRHIYRGQVCYILQDAGREDMFRFAPNIYRFITLMNGDHTLEEILAGGFTGNECLSPEDIAEVITHLYTMEAIACTYPPEVEGRLQALAAMRETKRPFKFGLNLLYFRIPLIDPERFLARAADLVRPVFSKTFFILFLLLLFFSAIQLIINWQALTTNIFDTVFTRSNLVILWFIYPVIKTIHELAHAFAVKKWGGEVHEIGIMFLLLMPVPYVNASAASAFAEKWQRVAVSGAGIIAELTLACTALLLWPNIEHGLLRTICYNTILIGGFSTLLFNGNPLVRFDGYYILSDILEIPNLAGRSQAFLWSRAEKLFLGIPYNETDKADHSSRKWFVFYGLTSFCYRLTIYASIFFFLVRYFATAGVIFGVFSMLQLLVAPAVRRVRLLLAHPGYRQYRVRILTTVALVITLPTVIVFTLPLPHSTRVEGVLWPQDDAIVRMQTPGVITRIVAEPGSRVGIGDLLFQGSDPILSYKIELLESQRDEYRLQAQAAFATSPFEARLFEERLQDLEERLRQKIIDRQRLTIKSGATGRFIVPEHSSITGTYHQQGDILAYVLNQGDAVKVLVSQREIDNITSNTRTVQLRAASSLERVLSGRVISANPQATRRLPHSALGTSGGGEILIDPARPESRQMMEEMFQLDVAIDPPLTVPLIGLRIYVRFSHDNEPLSLRFEKQLRQLFLTRLNQ